jgi:hypothetical protein
MLLTPVALLLAVQNAPAPNWVVLDQSDQGTVSIDKASIKPDGAGRLFTMRVAMVDKGEIFADMVLDCKANTIVTRAARMVKGAKTEALPVPDNGGKADTLDPKVENEAKLIAMVCN